jgi:hypothetical protein
VNGVKPLLGHAKVALGPAASLRSRFSQVRCDETFDLQPIQCCIDTADGDFAAAHEGQFSGEGNPIGVVSEAKDGEEKHEFELAEIMMLSHIFNNSEEIRKFANL